MSNKSWRFQVVLSVSLVLISIITGILSHEILGNPLHIAVVIWIIFNFISFNISELKRTGPRMYFRWICIWLGTFLISFLVLFSIILGFLHMWWIYVIFAMAVVVLGSHSFAYFKSIFKYHMKTLTALVCRS